jgi:integrase
VRREWRTNGRRDGKGGLSIKTVKNLNGLVSEILGWAVDEKEWLRANPASVRRFREPWEPKTGRVLKTEVVKRFLAKVEDPTLRELFRLAWAVGLRPGESTHIRLDGLLPDLGLVLVRRVWDGRDSTKRPKGNKQRARPIPPSLVPYLRQHVSRVIAAGEAFGVTYRWDLAYLFPHEDGSPYTVVQLEAAAAKASREAEVGHVTPKDFRSTWSAMSRQVAIDQDEIAAVSVGLGHVSMRTTDVHYDPMLDEPVPAPTAAEVRLAQRYDAKMRVVLGLSDDPDTDDGVPS